MGYFLILLHFKSVPIWTKNRSLLSSHRFEAIIICMETQKIKDSEIRQNNDWLVYSIKGRVDSFNFNRYKTEMNDCVEKGTKNFALDLSGTEFVSFSGIRYISDLAKNIADKGGHFALCAPSEKIKRQISIFASLKSMDIYRSVQEL